MLRSGNPPASSCVFFGGWGGAAVDAFTRSCAAFVAALRLNDGSRVRSSFCDRTQESNCVAPHPPCANRPRVNYPVQNVRPYREKSDPFAVENLDSNNVLEAEIQAIAPKAATGDLAAVMRKGALETKLLASIHALATILAIHTSVGTFFVRNRLNTRSPVPLFPGILSRRFFAARFPVYVYCIKPRAYDQEAEFDCFCRCLLSLETPACCTQVAFRSFFLQKQNFCLLYNAQFSVRQRWTDAVWCG